MFIKYIVALIFCIPLLMSAQDKLKIGQWKSHLPHKAGLSVTQSEDKVYYSTSSGVVVFDKKLAREESKFEGISINKEDGLFFNGPSVLSYHKGKKTLIIGYENGLISLLTDDGVTTFTDIFDYNQILIDKKINRIFNVSGNTILLAANYGLTEFNFVEEKFNFTLFTNPLIVNDALTFNQYYVMATNKGVYLFDNNKNGVIQDINQWTKLDIDSTLAIDAEAFSLSKYFGDLYIGVDTSIYKWSGEGRPEHFFSREGYNVGYISSQGSRLITTLNCIDDCKSEVLDLTVIQDSIYSAISYCSDRGLEAEADQYGRIWYADKYANFRTSLRVNVDCRHISVNGPYTNKVSQLAIGPDNTVIVATGGKNESWTPTWIQDGYYIYSKGDWSRISPYDYKPLDSILGYDIETVTIHPKTGNHYLGSFLSGLIIFNQEGEIINHYDYENSTLRGVPGDPLRTRISGLSFDEDDNLWICNFGATNPLSVKMANGDWKSFQLEGAGSTFSKIAIDQMNNKWIVIPDRDNSRGIVVFNEGDINNDNDDKVKVFSRGNSELSTNNVNDVAVDKEGDVWVATTEGVIVFECGDAFDDQCMGSRRKVDQDGITGFLLRYENVLSVAVDGANRKWFGTTNGVYVQSPSGEEEVAFFNVDNSPLLDNSIHDIKINPKTGEVFFATTKGICSYRSEAIEGGKSFEPSLTVFPNPVRPGYDGPIAIKGMAENAQIKIVDVEGRLVFEMEALGGQAIWDGRDYNGVKVNTGVYYVFASKVKEFAKPIGAVTKILIVK